MNNSVSKNVLSIHIIDDDESMLRFYEMKIPHVLDNVHVTTHLNRLDFLEKLKTYEKIDLIICDVMLPDGNGIQLKKNLDWLKKQIPIIFVTAITDMDKNTEVTKGLNILEKPITTTTFVEVLEKLKIEGIKLKSPRIS